MTTDPRTVIAVGDLVEIGLAYKMAEHPPYVGRHTLEPDEWTGVRGIVQRIDLTDLNLDIACANGRGVFVHRDRVRLVLGGVAQPSYDERVWPDAIERGQRKRGA